jgi:hypothetical protein
LNMGVGLNAMMPGMGNGMGNGIGLGNGMGMDAGMDMGYRAQGMGIPNYPGISQGMGPAGPYGNMGGLNPVGGGPSFSDIDDYRDSAGSSFGVAAGGGMYNPLPTGGQGMPPGHALPVGQMRTGLNTDAVLDERDLRAKQLKIEQARALEQQILQNKV